jgi:hypothetical protein
MPVLGTCAAIERFIPKKGWKAYPTLPSGGSSDVQRLSAGTVAPISSCL